MIFKPLWLFDNYFARKKKSNLINTTKFYFQWVIIFEHSSAKIITVKAYISIFELVEEIKFMDVYKSSEHPLLRKLETEYIHSFIYPVLREIISWQYRWVTWHVVSF